MGSDIPWPQPRQIPTSKFHRQQNRTKLSAGPQIFADLFCDLQNERHNAGYNPQASFTAQTAATWLNKAEAAITGYDTDQQLLLLQTSRSERAAIAILTLVRTR